MPKQASGPADFIVPLNMNGLEGRMMRVPPHNKKKREILLVYGHHAMLERWWGLVENLNDYGYVTMPDLPGFGGMDSFGKIGKKPTVDNFADYLAAFIKLRYKRKHVTIVGISFGFVVATRMLQRYPELVDKVDLMVSIVGFTHHDDFLMSARRRFIFRRITRLLAARPIAFFIRYVCLTDFVIRNLYSRLATAKRRFLEVSAEDFAAMTDFEVQLWQANDVRTHWLTTSEFLHIDNCRSQINVPLWHIASKGDHWFDNQIVEQHMQIVFRDYNLAWANSKAHTPSVIADKKGLAVLVPTKLRRVLARAA